MSENNKGSAGGEKVAHTFEKRPDPHQLTQNSDPSLNKDSRVAPGEGYDYEPYPERSIPLDQARQDIVRRICNLYSGSASEDDMQVYAQDSIFVDPWSYCDTRYKIAGQWYGT
jgi:hypothetical protein